MPDARTTPAANGRSDGVRALRAVRGAPLVAVLSLAFLVAGCGTDAAGDPADGAASGPPAGSTAGATATTGAEEGTVAVKEVRGPIDEALASRGEGLFRDRGCAACHRLESRLVGPALEGVTERRDYPWFFHMVTNPDSMIRRDSTAKALLAEYLTPMADQNVAPDEARALFEYFRSHDEASAGASVADEGGGDPSGSANVGEGS